MDEKTVAFHTLGCKVNKYETDAIAKTFTDAGYIIKKFNEFCDVYVINTCTVTSEANRKSLQFIRRAKKVNPKSVVVAAGCCVEAGEGGIAADIITGNLNKLEIVNLAEKIRISAKESKNNIGSSENTKEDMVYINRINQNEGQGKTVFEEPGNVLSREATRGFIKIEDGCDNMCSYCIIPLLRGRVRSRKKSSIVSEAMYLAESGFKEVVLTGIHVCSFSYETNKESDAVIDLAKEIAQIPGIERIRLGSIEPKSITKDFLKKITQVPGICPHFHISLQSGSNEILARMNRKYTAQEFEKTVALIRDEIPGSMITTDVITGFPGENEKNHLETIKLCDKIKFLDMHVFKYSKRKGTKAEKMSGHISPSIKNQRSLELMELAKKMKRQHYADALGQKGKILAETLKGNYIFGHTENYFEVKAAKANEGFTDEEFETNYKGNILEVVFERYDDEFIYGHII